MLILSRKHMESVVVGKAEGFACRLKVTVLAISRTKVKLGFEGDPDLRVHRSEVWERLGEAGQHRWPRSNPPAMNQELGRWEDDGGGPADSTPNRAPATKSREFDQSP